MKYFLTAILLLLGAGVCRADPDSDARAAIAIAQASRPHVHPTPEPPAVDKHPSPLKADDGGPDWHWDAVRQGYYRTRQVPAYPVFDAFGSAGGCSTGSCGPAGLFGGRFRR